ncbi:MAG: diaminopimelate epimerase [Tissierellia bacterium]|nr:diaminopimelate epimerase [Tissierellia bacterium]
MKFSKLHGAGNDFILIDNRQNLWSEEQLQAMAKKLCARKTSIGADGFMAVGKSAMPNHIKMLFINSDGSIGEMCGNGARCLARFAYDFSMVSSPMVIETTAGEVPAKRLDNQRYGIELNLPEVVKKYVPVDCDYDVHYVELGNPGIPHAIVILPNEKPIDEEELFQLGKTLRYHNEFPKGANVTFVTSIDGKLYANTWERGVEGFTLACGTGAGSTATALVELGLREANTPIVLNFPGGELEVTVYKQGSIIKKLLLVGPTFWVANGETVD